MRIVSTPLPRPRILVIEDDADIRGFLKLLFVRNGYDVETADSGLTGLAAFAHFLPDVIVLDLAMPDMDGLAFLERRRQIGHIKDIPVVVLSARDRAGDVMAATQAGANAYVAKPFDNAKLVASVRKLTGPVLMPAGASSQVSWQ